MSTATSLSVRALLNSAIARSGLPSRARAYSGLTPPAKALAVAASAHSSRQCGPAVSCVPSDAELETAASDVRFFLSSLEALPDAVAERVVLPFPSYQVDPVSWPGATLSRRVGAGASAACGGAGHAHGSSSPLPQRCCRGCRRPESVLTTSVDLRPGIEIEPHALAEILVKGGYERQDPVDEHGEFSLRGGILDVFPAGEDSAGSHRVHRRFGGIDSPLRSGHAAIDRDAGSVSDHPCQRTGGDRRRPRRACRCQPTSSITCARRAQSRVIVAEPEDVRAQIESGPSRSRPRSSSGRATRRPAIATDVARAALATSRARAQTVED